MKKGTLIGSIVIVAAVIGIIIYAATLPSPVKAPGARVALSGGSYVEHADYYDIATNYASSTPLLAKVGPGADAGAVALMKGFVADTISQFKQDGDFANLTPGDAAGMGLSSTTKEALQVNYLIASSPRTVSYIFTVYEDTLGAHPNTFFKTFVFDTTTGVPLALKDLFTPGSDYLGALSSIAREKLPSQLAEMADTSMIDAGTTPDVKNFSNFFFDNGYLTILFDPYQVAAYAAGPQTLRIRASDLTNVLKPEYR